MRTSVLLLLSIFVMETPVAEVARPDLVLYLPPSVNDLLIAETEHARIHHYARAENGIRLVKSIYMSIGQNGAGKKRAWDRKTPLGVYFVVDQLDTSRMHEKYGATAFPLDYPNVWDRLQDRSGSGIWLHGVQQGSERRPPLDTDGCLALPNDELLALAAHLRAGVTPIVVTRALGSNPDADKDELREALRAVVAAWVRAQNTGDVAAYLSLYAEGFEYRGLPRSEWSAFRTSNLSAREDRALRIEELLLLRDPSEEGQFLSRFQQVVTRGGQTVTTMKRLYWQRTSSGQFRIVAEDNG